ncbi:hypothetical protein AURDEDRAFT_155130 [Auricularia subglabra TFB-10046 SS5]|uniref:Uncharacterized protein n=1 Tax=Auricularia subglabra (strain TFB-10046 / SS5) TaxID=717982 RepID=J0CRJ5_AURST|nr:hypothetical protein AURDEDRAFT_155130 [Auricularia subglabra TFB-10046 SS5]
MADVSPAQTRPSSSVSMNSLHSVSSGNGSGADTSAHATPRNRLATDTEDEDVEMGDDEAGGRRAVGIVQGDDADDGTHGHLNLLIDGIVALGQDDDLAMGAPPGAPGATAPVAAQAGAEEAAEEDEDMAPSETPRQTMAPLPQPVLAPTPRPSVQVPRMEDGPYREEDVLIALQPVPACTLKEPVYIFVAAIHFVTHNLLW